MDSYSVSSPASQTATVVCGSIGLLCSSGVVYVSSSFTAAEENAPSTSPSSVSVGNPALSLSGVYRSSLSGRERRVVRLLVVGDLDEVRGVAGNFESLGDDGAYVLAPEGDLVGLQDRQLSIAGISQPRRIVVRDDGYYAGEVLGGARVDPSDPSPGNVTVQRIKVEGVIDVVLVGVRGRSP